MQTTVQNQSAYAYTGGKIFDPGLPTAIFIHGAQNDHSVWALQTRYFAHHGFGVLALDLPGHGRSAGAPLASVEAMADWLIALLDAVGVRHATLIGHSMGSLVALETSARAPARVSGMALVGTAYPMKVSDALLNAARDDEQSAIDMVNIWSHSTIAAKPSFPGPGFSVLGGSRRLMQRIAQQNPSKVFYSDFSACNAYAGGEAAAAAVRCPTLFVIGARDMMTPPKTTMILRQAIPHASVTQIEQCGHQVMSEQPDALLDSLFAFTQSASTGN